MVSLRNKLWSMPGGIRLAGRVLSLCAAALLSLQIICLALQYSLRSAPPEPGSLDAYVASLRSGLTFDLADATHRIYEGTTHSDGRRIAITENWLQWTLGHLYAPLARTQNTELLLAGGLVNCSERSQILKSLAEEAGLTCRFVGLSGHVVLEVETPTGWRVADPDYGVVYPMGIAEWQHESSAPLIDQVLSAAGYPEPTIEHYLQIVHSASDNVVLPLGSALSPRLDRVERACRWLATAIPLGCLLLGIAAMRAGSTGRKVERAAVAIAPAPLASSSRAA